MVVKYNGKNYFKKGGRLYEIKRYQNGDPVEPGFKGLSAANSGQSHSPSVWMTAGQTAGNLMNSLTGNRRTQEGAEYAENQARGYRNTGFERGIGAGLNAAASLDPTGSMALVNGAVSALRGAGNMIRNENQYGVSKSNAGEIVGNIFDPIGRVQQSINVGKKHGFGNALLDVATFGVHGNNLLKQDVQRGINRDNKLEMQQRQGLNKGNYRNDSVYAQDGARIKPRYATNDDQEPNVEIEDGEVYLGDPSQVIQHGNSRTSFESTHGAVFHGDKHGEDSDKDGMEGIPLTSDKGYIGSNYLGIDGKKAGKGNPTVASLMKPSIKFLHNAEDNSIDKYKNNPIAIAHHQKQLEKIKNQAEQNKFMEELYKSLKKKDRNLNEVMQKLSEAPVEDMTPDQTRLLEATQSKLMQGEANMQDDGMLDAQNAQLEQQAMQEGSNMNMQPQMEHGGSIHINPNNRGKFTESANRAGMGVQEYARHVLANKENYSGTQVKRANFARNASKWQEGGDVEQPQNESHTYAQELTNNINSNTSNNLKGNNMNPGQPQPILDNLSPEAQEMFQQLPPEIQQEIINMPANQREIAIQNYFAQMQDQAQQEQAPDMSQMEDMSQQASEQIAMRFGGSVYPDSANMQELNSPTAHIPRTLHNHYNPVTKSTAPYGTLGYDQFKNGGHTVINDGYQVGQYVTFKYGGKICSGRISKMDNHGNFTLE